MMTYKLETEQGAITLSPSGSIPWSALTGATLTLTFEDGSKVEAEVKGIIGLSKEGF